MAAAVYQFGDFQLDCGRFELLRKGRAILLERKPMELLILLLGGNGQLVTRNEIAVHLWSSEVFVDTEHGINTAIRKIRQVLGDDPDNPRFIQTVPAKGYRFVCKVEVSESASGDLQATDKANDLNEGDFVETLANGGIAKAAANPLVQIDKPADYMERSRFRSWLLSGAAVLAVCLPAATWFLRSPLPLRVAEYTEITHDGRPKEIAGTDGNRLYFNTDYEPQDTYQVAISGGEIAPVPVALPIPKIRDVSPDGSSLLVTSVDGGGSLWNVQVPAGSLRRLLTGAWVNSAAWSPDGRSVVYGPGNGDIYVIRSDGTGTRKLAAVGGLPGAFSWSPDGSKIRFSSDNRLWEMSSDGSELHPLLPGWRPSSSQCCGRWTPDRNFFVFLSRGYNSYGAVPASQLWVLDERRGLFRRAPTEPIQLTSGPIRWNTPIPSKDGTKIFAHGVILRGELVRYDAQSSRLQPWLGGISAEFVIFSPDGQYVAYVTFPEGILWRANRDGSHPVQLTDAPLYPLNPRWSPDGSQILFCNTFQVSRFWANHGHPEVIHLDEKPAIRTVPLV